MARDIVESLHHRLRDPRGLAGTDAALMKLASHEIQLLRQNLASLREALSSGGVMANFSVPHVFLFSPTTKNCILCGKTDDHNDHRVGP